MPPIINVGGDFVLSIFLQLQNYDNRLVAVIATNLFALHLGQAQTCSVIIRFNLASLLEKKKTTNMPTISAKHVLNLPGCKAIHRHLTITVVRNMALRSQMQEVVGDQKIG